jgi:hypothetical protein
VRGVIGCMPLCPDGGGTPAQAIRNQMPVATEDAEAFQTPPGWEEQDDNESEGGSRCVGIWRACRYARTEVGHLRRRSGIRCLWRLRMRKRFRLFPDGRNKMTASLKGEAGAWGYRVHAAMPGRRWDTCAGDPKSDAGGD